MDSDEEETSIFANRANKIIMSTAEAFEKLKNEKVEVSEKEEEEEEYDFIEKVKDKIKRKPAAKKGRKGKKAKTELDVSVEQVTPPKGTRRSTRNSKKLLEEEKSLEEQPSKVKAPTPQNLPKKAKKRLRDLKMKTAREVAQIEEEIRQTLFSVDKDVLEASETTRLIELERTIELKIRYMSDITKIEVLESEKFTTIFAKVADLYKLKATEILLCLEDTNIQLEDSPMSLNLKSYDVIDCIPFKASQLAVKEDDPNSLLVKFQSSDSRKKTEMQIHKLEKFQGFFEKYSKLLDIPLKSLTFEFDGETISGDETPEELDMESGCCIDVKVAKGTEKETNQNDSVIIDYIAPIPKSQMLDICVLD